MMSLDNACHYCTKRHLNCHSTCEAYAEFKKEMEVAKKRERMQMTNDTIYLEGIEIEGKEREEND